MRASNRSRRRLDGYNQDHEFFGYRQSI